MNSECGVRSVPLWRVGRHSAFEGDGISPANPSWDPPPTEMHMCSGGVDTGLLGAGRSLIVQNWKQPQRPSKEKWLNKSRAIHRLAALQKGVFADVV